MNSTASPIDYFALLKEAIADDKLEIYTIVSPPRTGSTALGVWLGNTSVDGQMTEPAAKFDTPETRMPDTYKDIYAYYQELAANSGSQPVKIALKEISQHIGPQKDHKAFFGLAKRVGILVRNPVLALESHLLLTANIIEILKLSPETKEALQEWVVPGTDLSHINDASDKSAWQQHIDHIRKNRDYSSLNQRMWLTTNTMFSSKALQQEVWAEAKEQLPNPDQVARDNGYRNWEHLVKDNLGMPKEQMCSGYQEPQPCDSRQRLVPKVLRECFEHRQGGWNALGEHYRKLKKAPNFSAIIDFTDLQLSPGTYGDALLAQMGLEKTAKEHKHPQFKTGYGTHTTDHAGLEDALFGRAKNIDSFEPPVKSPVTMDKLPAFLQRDLPNTFTTYLEVLGDTHKIQTPGESTEALLSKPISSADARTIQNIDPVYSYIRVITATDMQPDKKREMTASIRRHSGQYAEYFNMIDQVQLQSKTALDHTPKSQYTL